MFLKSECIPKFMLNGVLLMISINFLTTPFDKIISVQLHFLAQAYFFRTVHRFSIGSKDLGSHFGTLILGWFSRSFITFDVFLGCLSHWNTTFFWLRTLGFPEEFGDNPPSLFSLLSLKRQFTAPQYENHMLDNSVLVVKSLTFSPPNIRVLAVVWQLSSCFIWLQNFPPEG